MKFLPCLLFMMLCLKMQGQPCAAPPKFMQNRGFTPGRAALSTSEKRQMGLVLLEIGNSTDQNAAKKSKQYQHPRWDDQGYLSSITRDRNGHIYVAPKPNVNMLHTPGESLNTIFRVHTQNETMSPFQKLPGSVQISNENPYGILGLAYDCFTDHLLVSTVNGSSQKKENGKVYAIDVNSGRIMPLVNHLDVLGLVVAKTTNSGFELLLASARESVIYSLPIDENLKVLGPAKPVISLEGLGPRGDDRGRKMEYIDDQLIVYGTPFYYNLSAPSISKETKYRFNLDNETNNWQLVSIE